jgi:predicted unusual protein kinase regulating ubiquinone biosynthesis (AarF/ABC1/UbiB family)
VTTVTEKDHKTFIDICLALLNFNGREAAKHMLSHRNLDDSGPSFEGFASGIQKIVQKARDENAFEHIGEYITTICNLSCEYRVALIPEVINVAMAIKVCEGISLALNPELELAKVAIPTVLKGQAKYMMNQAKKKFNMKRTS